MAALEREQHGLPDDVWGPYPIYDDIAHFEYGRRMWRIPQMRARLLAHWLDARHPHRERFLERRQQVENVLESGESPQELDTRLRRQGTSLRCLAREIPPVFGSFFSDTLRAGTDGKRTASGR